MVTHSYQVSVDWTGDRGVGTVDYRSYGRQHVVRAAGKPDILGSADRTFHGDRDRWNPEELLLSALAECHMLSYLHVAASHGVTVMAYTDEATGTMEQDSNGGGHFTSASLHPRVVVSDASMVALARELHSEAAAKCFIAASVNFPVDHHPIVTSIG